MFKKLLKLYLECWRPHRGESAAEAVSHFCVPKLNGAFLVRIITIAVAGYVIFGFILIPEFIVGASMEPTYFRRGFTFCWRGKYLFSKPERGDIGERNIYPDFYYADTKCSLNTLIKRPFY